MNTLSKDILIYSDLQPDERELFKSKARKLKKHERARWEDSALCTWIFRPPAQGGCE
jgi:hypothetical protein